MPMPHPPKPLSQPLSVGVHKLVNKASSRCRQMIKNEEGWKMVPYVCAAGKWTVGAGRRLYPDSKIKGLTYNKLLNRWFGRITEETAERLLSEDIEKCEKAIIELVDVPLNQNQFDALVIFILNIGRNAFAGSTLLRFVNARLWGSAAKQFDRWVHDDFGSVIDGLVARQKRTRALFQTLVALLLVLGLAMPVPAEAKKRFSVKRFVCNVATAPLWLTEETIRHCAVAYCYSRIHGYRDPWYRIAAEVSREKILREPRQ